MSYNPPHFPKRITPLSGWSSPEFGQPGTVGQNRDNDQNMPQRVAPSANIVDPAPLGVRMPTVVDNWMVGVVKFCF